MRPHRLSWLLAKHTHARPELPRVQTANPRDATTVPVNDGFEIRELDRGGGGGWIVHRSCPQGANMPPSLLFSLLFSHFHASVDLLHLLPDEQFAEPSPPAKRAQSSSPGRRGRKARPNRAAAGPPRCVVREPGPSPTCSLPCLESPRLTTCSTCHACGSLR